jgi:hypothetical protein
MNSLARVTPRPLAGEGRGGPRSEEGSVSRLDIWQKHHTNLPIQREIFPR